MASKKVNKATFSYGGEELTITKSSTQAAVQYTGARGKTSGRQRGSAVPTSIENFEVVTSKSGIDQKLDTLRNDPDVAVGTHVWHVDGENETPFIPTGNLYIEFVADSDPLKQQEILERLGLNIKEIVGVGAYRVSVSSLSPNPVKCAMELQKSEIVMVAEPEFVTMPSTSGFLTPGGRFISTQWHLENTGQAIPAVDVPNSVYAASHFKRGADAKVRAAWSYLGSLGDSSLKIAVIDTGFAADHPQLRGDGTKLRNQINAVNRTSDVSPFVRMSDGSYGVFSHGTSCAAVAAGALDAQGILGAAPNARLILIKLEVLSDDAIKTAFELALLNGADVISCSLGYPRPVPLSTYVSNYISKVAREGRSGRGLPMFFAAGNANPASNYQPRQVSDFAAHAEGICVTASNSLDLRASYSFYGPTAFLCAPSNGDAGVGITTATCDISSDGRNLVMGYTSGFGGTSSSAPLVAGICALMLTANPNLTLSDIKNILRQSVDKIGPAGTYNAQGRSDYYGYGRVNALRAVQLASAVGGSVTSTPVSTPAGGTTTTPQQPPASDIQRGRVVSPTLNVRSGPSTGYGKVAQLQKDDVVNLFERVGTWYRIGTGQYVSGDYIQVLSTPSPAKHLGKVISTILNVRSGPSTANSKVGQLSLGNMVNILEKSADGWYRIGTGQWVLGRYVREV